MRSQQDKDRCLVLLLHAATGLANMAATGRRWDLDLASSATLLAGSMGGWFGSGLVVVGRGRGEIS